MTARNHLDRNALALGHHVVCGCCGGNGISNGGRCPPCEGRGVIPGPAWLPPWLRLHVEDEADVVDLSPTADEADLVDLGRD
jgi:hypothetical protein